MVMPCAVSTASSGDSGRSGRRPSMRKVTSAPSAPTTGSRKRSVEPLSPQKRSACAGISPAMGTMRNVPAPSSVMSAPSARRQRAVAAMSAETPSHRSATGCAPSAAQMSRRCACDLEAGMRTLPVRGPGKTV